LAIGTVKNKEPCLELSGPLQSFVYFVSQKLKKVLLWNMITIREGFHCMRRTIDSYK